MVDVEVVDFSECKVAALEHRGNPQDLMESFKTFAAWRASTEESPAETHNSYCLAHTNPETTAPEDFKFDICSVVDADVKPNEFGVMTKTIPGGQCAKFRHVGSRTHAVLGPKVRYLFVEWLKANGKRLRGHPSIFHYINSADEVAEDQLITDVYLPIQ